VKFKKTLLSPKKANPKEPPLWISEFESDLKMGEEEALERLGSYNEEVRDLFDQAMRGDNLAAGVLVEYASVAVEVLEQIANQRPRILQPMSRQQIRWPAFIGPKEFQLERNRELMEKLKLGDKSPFRHKWNPKSPATFTAYSMLYWLVENQSTLGLPPISKKTISDWFEIGWKSLSESLNGHPEKYIYLREKIEQHADKESARKQEKRNPETVIRAKMKDAVRQSFLSVTRNIPL
jgi:hypothetical protein